MKIKAHPKEREQIIIIYSRYLLPSEQLYSFQHYSNLLQQCLFMLSLAFVLTAVHYAWLIREKSTTKILMATTTTGCNTDRFMCVFVVCHSLTYYILVEQPHAILWLPKIENTLFSLTILLSLKESLVQKSLKVNFLQKLTEGTFYLDCKILLLQHWPCKFISLTAYA